MLLKVSQGWKLAYTRSPYAALMLGKAANKKSNRAEQDEQSASNSSTWRWGQETRTNGENKGNIVYMPRLQDISLLLNDLSVLSISGTCFRIWMGNLLGEWNISGCVCVLLQTRESWLQSAIRTSASTWAYIFRGHLRHFYTNKWRKDSFFSCKKNRPRL